MKADTPPRDPPRVPVMVTLVNGGGEPSQRVVAKTVESRDEIAKNVEHFPMLSRGAARRPQQHSSTASLSSRYVDSLRSKMRGSSNALKCPISLPAFLAQVCSTPCALPRPIIAHQDQEARQATLHSTSRLFETCHESTLPLLVGEIVTNTPARKHKHKLAMPRLQEWKGFAHALSQ